MFTGNHHRRHSVNLSWRSYCPALKHASRQLGRKVLAALCKCVFLLVVLEPCGLFFETEAELNKSSAEAIEGFVEFVGPLAQVVSRSSVARARRLLPTDVKFSGDDAAPRSLPVTGHRLANGLLAPLRC